jgi:hypothetical protein
MLIGRSIPIRVHTRWKSGEEEKWLRASIRRRSAVWEPPLRLNNRLRSLFNDIQSYRTVVLKDSAVVPRVNLRDLSNPSCRLPVAIDSVC